MPRNPRSARRRKNPSRRAIQNTTPAAVTGFRWDVSFPVNWGFPPDPTHITVTMDTTGGTVLDIDSADARAQWLLTIVNSGGGYVISPCIGITNQSEGDQVILLLSFDGYEPETGTAAFLSYVPKPGTVVGPTGGTCIGIGVQQLPVPPGAIVAVFSDQF
jgi:hypothetical protein